MNAINEIEKKAEKLFYVFKNSLGNCRYTFKDGKDANFLNGEYITDSAKEVEELQAEVDARHPHIYVDAARATVTTDKIDPLAEIRAKAIADYKAEMAAALLKTNDMGETDQTGKLQGINNSDLLADAMAGSTSTDGAATVGNTSAEAPATTVAVALPGNVGAKIIPKVG